MSGDLDSIDLDLVVSSDRVLPKVTEFRRERGFVACTTLPGLAASVSIANDTRLTVGFSRPLVGLLIHHSFQRLCQ